MIVTKGTGINVYNVIQQQMNSSFTLDGGPPSLFVYSWEARCCDPPSGPTGCYNTSVYNNQGLSYGAHTLKIYMFSYLGPNSYDGTKYCDFVFDYAVISTPTSSVISSLSTSSTVPFSTANPDSSNQHSKYVLLLPCGDKLLTSCSKKLSAAVGGAVGGAAAAMAVMLAVVCYRRRGYWHQRTHSEVDPEPTQSSFQPTTFVDNPLLNREAPHDWSPSSLLQEDTDLEASDIPPSAMMQKATTPLATDHAPTSSVTAGQYALPSKPEVDAAAHMTVTPNSIMPKITSAPMSAHVTGDIQGLSTNLLREDVNLATDNPSLSPTPPKSGLSSVVADAPASAAAPKQHSSLRQPSQPAETQANVHAFSTPSPVIPPARGSQMGTRLTEEQTDLVQRLITQNVPLVTVAGVMEGWLKSERPSESGEGSGSRNTPSAAHSENPPDYNFA